MKQFYSYLYKDPVTNIARYAGKGHGNRYNHHTKHTRFTNKALAGWISNLKNNGLEPIIYIVPALDEDHAFLLEECFVKIYGRLDLGTGTLFNHTNGGEGHTGPLTKEHKEKISKSLLGSPPTKGMTGKHHSEETKQKMSNSQKGHKPFVWTYEQRKKQSETMKGRKVPWIQKQKGTKRPTVSCPYCNKLGGKGAIVRWHFSNCKRKGL